MTPTEKNKDSSLVWLFLIIGVGILVSMSFVFFILKGYKKRRPLVIKPSSVESFVDVSEALYKAFYPLTKQGYSFVVSPSVNKDELLFSESLKQFFPEVESKPKKTITITLDKVNLDLEPPPPTQLYTCNENNRFILHRKMEKKWNKKIYFAICRENDGLLILSYAKKTPPSEVQAVKEAPVDLPGKEEKEEKDSPVDLSDVEKQI